MNTPAKTCTFNLLRSICLLLILSIPSLAAEPRKPNVVFVIADDLGYGDLGCFGQKKIRTPNLDRMAAEGMRFTQHYSGNAVCAPSRCVLMTGKHPGHAFIRNNKELQPEGQHPIPAGTITLAKLFKQQGYGTGAFGKWGLGGPGSTGDPLKQGIDRFFGYNCQRHAHNFYTTYLWDNDQRVQLGNPEIAIPQKLPDGADSNDVASYRPYSGVKFSADLIFEQARQFIREHREQSFFLYVPTTIPHLALQVPEDSVAEYRGLWSDPPYPGGNGYLPHHSPRAAYAAMITRMDREIGRIMNLIAELGLDDNTIFVFTSDNGPLNDRFAGTDTDFFQSAGPLRGRKGSLYEGGFRVPTIVRWKGQIAPSTVSNRVTGFEDWLPTLMDLIGAAGSAPSEIDGISFAPTLRGQSQVPRPFLYREFPGYGGWQSVRVGDWKGVRQNLNPRGKNAPPPRMELELYNLKDDIGETKNVALHHAEIIGQMERILRDQHTPSEVFPVMALDPR